MIGYYNKSVILTYIGLTFSIVGVYFSIHLSYDNAFICLIIAGICDLFDGKVASLVKRDKDQKAFGKEIDSLCDVVSFLVFPFVLFIMLASSYWYVGIIYVLCGIIRLAWFNVFFEVGSTHYTGLPVTYAALIFPVLYCLITFLSLPSILYVVFYILVAICFIVNIAIKKPTGIWYVVFLFLAIITSIVIIIL